MTLHDINIKPAPVEKDKDGSRLMMDLTAKTYRYIEEEGVK